jgi:DHA3 family tetracycline resistance protein-like MFS transporter
LARNNWSVALGSIRLNVPIVTGGALITALGAFLLVTMPEHVALESSLRTQRPTWRGMGATVAPGARLVRGSPLLVTILAMPLFFGISGEGFDRLAPDHFIQDFRFPPLGPLQPVVWFGIMAVGATLLGLACTEVVRRRVTLNAYPAIARTLSALSAIHVASYIGFGLAGNFPLALACYWGAGVARRTSAPLYSAWLARSVEPRVRATVISMSGLVDAVGQIAGGPIVGVIGTVASLRTAMLACGVALSPAIALYLRAGRLGWASRHDLGARTRSAGISPE